MRPEDAAQDVQLVEHDVAQAHEEVGPAAVVGKDADVQHVGIGEHHVGVAPGPRALVCRRISVVGHGHESGDLQGCEGAQLVLGEGLGGEDQEGRTRSWVDGGLGDRELVAERLARGRACRHGHRTTVAGHVDGGRLMRPEAAFWHQLGDSRR